MGTSCLERSRSRSPVVAAQIGANGCRCSSPPALVRIECKVPLEVERLVAICCPQLLDEGERGVEVRHFAAVLEVVEELCPWVTPVRLGICTIPARGPSRLLGGEAGAKPKWAQATLLAEVAGKPGITRLLPARMEGIGVRVVGWQGSGDLAANARANCYAKFLPGKDYRKGEVIRVLLR